jgi:hypothetical protein
MLPTTPSSEHGRPRREDPRGAPGAGSVRSDRLALRDGDDVGHGLEDDARHAAEPRGVDDHHVVVALRLGAAAPTSSSRPAAGRRRPPRPGRRRWGASAARGAAFAHAGEVDSRIQCPSEAGLLPDAVERHAHGALRIQVHEERPGAAAGEGIGAVERHCRLAHASFQAGKCDVCFKLG